MQTKSFRFRKHMAKSENETVTGQNIVLTTKTSKTGSQQTKGNAQKSTS